jgi:aspartate racemase
MGLYHTATRERGIEILAPETEDQQRVMQIIFSIKAGRHDASFKQELREIARRLYTRGARALILGCTEISFTLSQSDFAIPVYDAMTILAEASIREALHASVPEPVSVTHTSSAIAPRLSFVPSAAA